MDVDALLQWAAMGRHGFYVWLAFGATVGVLGALVLHTRVDASRLRSELELDLQLRQREAMAGNTPHAAGASMPPGMRAKDDTKDGAMDQAIDRKRAAVPDNPFTQS